ncbi:NAD(P)/FAD-dependent oxidoreductase [Bordetella sp. BOR01]|uniref:NAD(P)/FAD-dependent oxidoreductase n=1 Tax=Bordetella sp. BOR01 TaxID=2854779 RepID=UPI001C463779|nr:NAD(P)/FAD-dependent oxidoreductase [Bordetella sp. BOR01]MBV7485008.1 NAD(P)/FAD-dependent oxidoreductase [Bordetella sp. BOR01]
MHNIDCAVIGAGAVGLAIARELALAGREVIMLEAEPTFGAHTSSRNSEVIHAGISYPADSLKARFCVQGKHALYQYCARRGIDHARIGKLIVATGPDDLAGLQGYVRRAQEAGVNDLRMIDQHELADLEPAVRGLGAVHSPSTGIVDSHGLMLALLGDAENAGAMLVANSPVLDGEIAHEGIVLRLGGAQQTEILCANVVNSAGLCATRVAAGLKNLAAGSVPRIHYARGRYYTMSGASPFRHLVYPVTREATMRVHVTLDLAGQCRFGPDLEWIDEVDYRFGDEREALFYAGIRRYFPALPDGALQPGYTGIRPRLAGPDAPLHSGADDFRIEGPRHHGAKGLVNLFGIESPGLTASLAIGQYVRDMVAQA